MDRIRTMPRRVQVSLLFAGISVLSMTAAVVFLVTGSSAGSAEPMAPADKSVERGMTLFVDKGCVICHTHAGLAPGLDNPRIGPRGAPNLTDYSAEPEFLREWLADPASVRPNTTMPDLELDDDEIDALIAFLNWKEDDR